MLRSAILCALVCAQVCAQEVNAPDKIKVPTGRLAAVVVQWSGDSFAYTADPGIDVFREYDPDAKVCRLRCLSYTPGEYRIHCVACKGGVLTPFATTTVVVGKAAPRPIDPTPTPDPSPAQADKLYLIVVEGPDARTPEAARVLTDKALWSDLEARGNRWRLIPSTDPVAEKNGYLRLADKVGFPALLLLSEQGNVLNVRKLPDTADGVRNAVKEYQK